MDTKEKQIIVTLISTILIFVIYSLCVYNKYIEPNPAIIHDFRFWGYAFLILIPIAIVAQIVIHIIFAIINKVITQQDMDTKSDERDKIIDLKATRISHWIFTLGFLLAMIALAIGYDPYMMFLVLFSAGFLSGIVSELAKLYFYRKGF